MKGKPILCAIDFSQSSLEALSWALKMARQAQASLTILFCYRLIGTENDEETLALKKNMEHEAVGKFHEIERKFIHGNATPYQFITEVGFFSYRIETFLRQHPVGLLVMGNSIIPNFNEYKNFGFDKFLEETKVPVVIVPEGAGGIIKI